MYMDRQRYNIKSSLHPTPGKKYIILLCITWLFLLEMGRNGPRSRYGLCPFLQFGPMTVIMLKYGDDTKWYLPVLKYCFFYLCMRSGYQENEYTYTEGLEKKTSISFFFFWWVLYSIRGDWIYFISSLFLNIQ